MARFVMARVHCITINLDGKFLTITAALRLFRLQEILVAGHFPLPFDAHKHKCGVRLI
jgi:hypothetical protein